MTPASPREPSSVRNSLRTAKTVVLILFYLALAGALVLLPLRGVLESVGCDYERDLGGPLPEPALLRYHWLRGHLQQEFTGYGPGEVVIPVFSVVALSHQACALTNIATLQPELKPEIVPLLAELARRALLPEVAIYRRDPRQVNDLGDQGLYLSHLNLILGCYRHLSGDPRYDELHARVTAYLRERSLADGDYHMRSFSYSTKFPADQTVTLLSLYLYDRCHGTTLADEPIDGWLKYMATQGATPSGLHRSALDETLTSELPRGCALSWSILYMGQFAPTDALALYRRYRDQFYKTYLGMGGFREWPPGTNYGSNADAGPVLFNIGTAATGFGIGPARLFRDRRTYVSLMRTASLVGLPAEWDGRRWYRLAPVLGEAIMLHAETATPWFGPLPSAAFDDSPPFPLGAWLALAALASTVAICCLRIRRLACPLIRQCSPPKP